MATGSLIQTIRARVSATLDAALSKLLRYDLSRTDVLKWVYFARQVLVVILVSVVTIAGLSAYLSTKQAEGLLHDSLSNQARAIAGAVARAAFVPLTLEDDKSLSDLVASYRSTAHISDLRIKDAQGRLRGKLSSGKTATEVLTTVTPIIPLTDAAAGTEAKPSAPIGSVEVDMRTDWIAAKTKTIALTNLAISGSLAVLILLIGMYMIRNLVDRTRELVGEARLAEQIKAANAELESFAHSVSHDLRAPLRHINGYVELLREDAAPLLTGQTTKYLDTIADAAKKMGVLIDDLLSFSRMGRAEMLKTRVNVEQLVKEILEDMQPDTKDRDIVWTIGQLAEVHADPSMLRLVLINLIGNAVKYTSKRPQAQIEIGCTPGQSELVFFIRDNGAGFNMEYSDKLFGVFQRLHRADEFEGTGIGLANVRRIIERHGGRTWARGAPDQGATFYFSLPSHKGA